MLKANQTTQNVRRVKIMVRTIVCTAVLTAVLGTALAKDSSAAVRVPVRAAETRFTLTDGRNPQSYLIGDSTGALYGTTYLGGDTRCDKGCGTIFKLTPSGSRYTESILYAFHGTPDGFNPAAGLIADSSGSFYGTTQNGGANGWGSVFKLTPTKHGYVESVVYSFQGDPNGSTPFSSLVEDRTGALYGTAFDYGPVIFGTVFKLTPHDDGYDYSILHSFNGGDGAYPYASLISDTSGALYGTAESGGAGGIGNGTVFKLTPNGNSYDFSVLYTFTGGSDGATPEAAVLLDSRGALYGTTLNGGTFGKGTVFKLTPADGVYSESVLHSFAGGADGHHPVAPLVGTLYGTTQGLTQQRDPRLGTVFKLAPNGSGYDYSVLHVFTGGTDGSTLDSSLIEDGRGRLYGTTFEGGTTGLGTVFRLSPDSNGYRKSVLHNFQR
jgi:uncharacterized repeat protein (TIGR03803 family)